MAELIALPTSPMGVARSEQVRIVETLRCANWINIGHIDRGQDEASWELLATHQDKTWSIVDCASFVVMKERSITTALTSDRHFGQAGFNRVLRDL
jgi:predicted nucleic acid-binding protein